MADYGVLDKMLHRIALQATPVAEMSFDIDQRMVKSDPAAIVELPTSSCPDWLGPAPPRFSADCMRAANSAR